MHTRIDDATGHDPTGHDPTGHDPTGHDPTGHDATGHDAVGESGRAASPKSVPPRSPKRLVLDWATGVAPLVATPAELAMSTPVHGIWRCPVCRDPVPRPHRPGRAKVYCSNACRQKAYRWRCRRRSRLVVTRPPSRASTFVKAHALRSDDDLVTPLLDARGRRVTACGTFAHPARDQPQRHRHTAFYAPVDRMGPSTTTCCRCVDLLGVERQPMEEVLAAIERTSPPPRRRTVSPGGP